MIAIQQIRAGRAMLNWSQRELAVAAGISPRNLQNIETGMVVPRLETIKAIKSALEKAGIEFGTGCAVALRQEIFDMEKREGEGALESLVHDFIESFRQGAEELLLCNTDERRWIESVMSATADIYYGALKKYGIKERCLLAHGDTTILSAPASYRWIPKGYFSEVSYAVYGHTLALIIWHPSVRIAVIRNALIADSYRRHFDLIWERAEIPPFVKLAQQYPDLNKPRIWLSEDELARLAGAAEEEEEIQPQNLCA